MEKDAMTEWKNTDPRIDLIDSKRANIVIIYPGPDHDLSCLATVETKHSWSIFTNLPTGSKHAFVGPDDNWDDAWQWTFAPR